MFLLESEKFKCDDDALIKYFVIVVLEISECQWMYLNREDRILSADVKSSFIDCLFHFSGFLLFQDFALFFVNFPMLVSMFIRAVFCLFAVSTDEGCFSVTNFTTLGC